MCCELSSPSPCNLSPSPMVSRIIASKTYPTVPSPPRRPKLGVNVDRANMRQQFRSLPSRTRRGTPAGPSSGPQQYLHPDDVRPRRTTFHKLRSLGNHGTPGGKRLRHLLGVVSSRRVCRAV